MGVVFENGKRDGHGSTVPDMRMELLARVEAESRSLLDRGLDSSADLDDVSNAVAKVMDLYHDVQEDIDYQPGMACKRGCIHCCYNQISLTPPEALYFGKYVLETFSRSQVMKLKEKVRKTVRLIRGKNRKELGAIRHLTPCPFLMDGTCGVHVARPLVCRGWNAINSDQCRVSNESHDPMTMIESHSLPRELAEQAQLGLLRSSGAHGLEAGFLVMSRAVHLIFTRGLDNCARDWLSGKPFFARPPSE